ncbi:MAG: UvrD-helicase domain-containing protein [Bacilli bacterium]|nr:UvrD-helicase domain-containing protein [Bacilli bacterium]
MPKWTDEQLSAINTTGSNIIVSAGAGSGKTAVLTERVITKLQTGIKINELLILTFTNAAAAEMKDRIRRKINEHPELSDNLDYLDSAYITTFDSFTLSLVKKYNYILNVSPSLSIVDSGLISILKEEILDDIFDELYLENNSLFLNFINDFAIKNDTGLKSSIMKIIKSLELKSDKEYFLNNYINIYLNDEKINAYIDEFNRLLELEIKDIETNLMYISESDYYDYYDEMVKSLDSLVKSRSYDEILKNINVTLPRRPRGSDDVLEYKENIDASLKNLKAYLRFESEDEIRETFEIIKKYIEIILEIIKRFDRRVLEYKNKNDLYEFTDIELMAIKLLKENDYIREEIKNYYKEICVDEYQDTNDLQEEFIKLIENNNVYMVGDIKQSIYGFRNANPSIFKEKYDKYSQLSGGIKIDLLKNFRSRSEVLDGINKIFSLIMDDSLGGADYVSSHQMVFGNLSYEENKCEKQNYNLEILNYNYEDKFFTKEELEAFIIGKDILKRINDGMEVVDKYSWTLRKSRYEDFCIIMDRGTNYPTYKKIFEYLGIPLMIYEDKKLTTEIDMMIINNILGLILKVNDNSFDTEFKYCFMSVARSYLFQYSDSKIFEIIKNKTYKDTEIYSICKEISLNLDVLNSYEILELILEKFNFYENTIKVGNMEDTIIRINNLLDIAKNLSSVGYTINDFKDYVTKMIDGKNEITYKINSASGNSVKIMNIHKSKGLEFPVCYFSGYHKEFNTMDIKDRFIFDNKYGIITPFFKEGVGSVILKDLLKNKYMIDNISERIRLFYVALTRAKEKMIIVTSLDEEKKNVKKIVDYNIRRKYNSFLSIMNSISGNMRDYIINVDLNTLGITKDYIYGSNKKDKIENQNIEKINYTNIIVDNEEITKKHASKTINNLITKEEQSTLDYGTYLHRIFEETDFLNIKDNNPYKDKINEFVSKLNIDDKTSIYKEHEFIFEDKDITYHGIIDLVLIKDDLIKIVDYKLKNIDDPKYIEQLKVYYNYLKSIFNKDIKVYLYSIINSELREINGEDLNG